MTADPDPDADADIEIAHREYYRFLPFRKERGRCRRFIAGKLYQDKRQKALQVKVDRRDSLELRLRQRQERRRKHRLIFDDFFRPNHTLRPLLQRPVARVSNWRYYRPDVRCWCDADRVLLAMLGIEVV